MFLDDQLIEIGRNAKRNGFDAINQMSQACFINLSKNIKENTNNEQTLAQFKRVNNTWKLAVDTLEKEGISFVKREGFEIILKSKKELAPIVEALGIKN